MAKTTEPPVEAGDVDDEQPTLTPVAARATVDELTANNLREYSRASIRRLRSGQSGVLPVVLGLFLISVIFQSLNSNFLTAGNIVNLLVQGAVYMLLAMAEVFVLLLGEIDLSAGFVGGVGGIIAAELVTSEHGSWSWWAACIAALLVCALIGAFMGTIITRLGAIGSPRS